MRRIIEFLWFIMVAIILSSTLISAYAIQPTLSLNGESDDLSSGVWNNFDFSRPVKDWIDAAKKFGGESGVVDLVLAQANLDGSVYLPFPFESEGYLMSFSQMDLVEPYLESFNSDGLKVILSIQPLKENITRIIDILLSRYEHNKSVIGVNIDVEWKETGEAYHVSNQERDLWLQQIRSYDHNYQLFLTYFKDSAHFPDDTDGLVVLFDGEEELQSNLLIQYSELAEHYRNVGIYTGYSSVSSIASNERILAAVPNTRFIIHTDDVFSNKKILLFVMDDVQIDWLESTSISLIDLHLEKEVPATLGVIPFNFDVLNVGGGFLAENIMNLNTNYFDLFEIAQNGYTHNEIEELENKSLQEQKTIIEKGLNILNFLGIEPITFDPPFGSVDETTLKVLDELGFKVVIDLYGSLQSEEFTVLDSVIFLAEQKDDDTVLKSAEQLMAEIDQKSDEEVVIILYQIHDFLTDSTGKFSEFSQVLDELITSKKYMFRTAKQYYETLGMENIITPSSTQLDWSLFLIVPVAGVLAAFAFFLIRRKRASKPSVRAIISVRNFTPKPYKQIRRD